MFLVKLFIVSIVLDVGRTLFEWLVLLIKKQRFDGDYLTDKEMCVIIPCHNSQDTIIRTLYFAPRNYHMICVANACDDKTEEILRASEYMSNMTVLSTPISGKMRAIKMGMEKAREMGFTHALVLDDDVKATRTSKALYRVNKSKAITALPVLPLHSDTFITMGQWIEYAYMCVSKACQGRLGGNVIMASGAGGIYRVDTFLDRLVKEHDGIFCGDDLQLSLIAHIKGEEIDFNEASVIETVPPYSIGKWWKQRVGRWELSPLKNFRHSFRVLLMWHTPYWIRFSIAYRYWTQVNDVVRIVSFPMAVYMYPHYAFGLLWLLFFCMILKLAMFYKLFGSYSPHGAKMAVLFPFYSLLMWASRLAALPEAIGMAFKKYPKGV